MLKIILLVVSILLTYNKALPKEIQCPAHCKCDIFEKYRRATCNNQSLVVVDADIPAEVELLDLSYNLIHDLQDHTFFDLKLTSLKLLNLSHNKVGHIHMNAFADITSLRTIDLSYNNIEYILVNWFWDIPTLQELYLQKNNLRKLHDGPTIESKSLRVLDISDCSLLHIHDQSFTKIPNLETLDISRNSLIQLQVNVIKPLSNLKVLKLENNTWHCNDAMTKLINYCKRRGISCKNPCINSLPIKEEKFQRIIVQPDIDVDEPPNSWIYEDQELNQTKIIEVCSNSNDTVAQKTLLMEIIELSPVLALVIPFLFGLGLGLVIACGVTAKPMKQKPKKKIPAKRRCSIIRNRRMDDFYDYPLMQPEMFEVCDTTPMPVRKSILDSDTGLDRFT